MSIESEVHRPLADYSANIWEDLLTYFSESELGSTETLKEKRNTLKEVVKESFMASKVNPIDNIKFIDALCRLGVSYHFEIDIIEQLGNLFDSLDFNGLVRHDECDLYTVGLLFQGFSSSGSNFPLMCLRSSRERMGRDLVADALGILSLYEASQWNTHGEDIMDEALAFSSNHLKALPFQSIPYHLAVRIKNALKHPYHKGISRIEARKYISYYEAEEKRDTILLEFAKIDFNMLQ